VHILKTTKIKHDEKRLVFSFLSETEALFNPVTVG